MLLVIDILARIDDTNDGGDEGQSRWLLTISLNGVVGQVNVPLKKPFGDGFADEVKWYLETYIPKSPFDAQRARRIASSMQEYSRELYFRLDLPEVERLLSPFTEHSVMINVRQLGEEQDKSIHSLYWELLEDPELWSPSQVTITVQRHFDGCFKQLANKDTSTTDVGLKGSILEPAINVLLVLARDSTVDDASADLAYQHILAAQTELDQTPDSRHLRLQIVRPGSFDAFVKHLDRSSTLHGPGFFHVVHFDLHGRVAKNKITGIKEAFLYFARKRSAKLIAIPARDIAEMLVTHGVKIAVLNSCDSARSNSDSGANLAKVFVTAGVENVLAMSHRFLESAASSFVKSFYRSFLIDNRPFSVSAAAARASLRCEALRPTRFKTKEPLSDWVIPVVYTGKHDVTLPLLLHHERVPAPVAGSLNAHTPVFGRRFDVLDVDRIVTEHSCVMITGPPGVGKTVFVDEMTRIWKQTSFFDLIIRLDFNRLKIRTRLNLVNHLFAAIQAAHIPMDALSENDSVLQSVSSEGKEASIMSVMRNKSTVLIFEGLREDYRNLPMATSAPNLTSRELDDLCQLINQVTSMANNGGLFPGTRVILVLRHDYDEKWQNKLECSEGLGTYRLSRLKLADAFDLAKETMSTVGVAAPRWYQRDADWLERILMLCDLNPLTVRFVIGLMGDDAKTYFERLLMSTAPPNISNDLPNLSSSVLLEMHVIWHSLFPPLKLALCFLGLYWHSGPFIDTFLKRMADLGICEQSESLVKVLTIAGNRMWLESEDDKRITYIHPLFTMFLRNRICDNDPTWTEAVHDENAFSAFSTLRCIFMQLDPPSGFREDIVQMFLIDMDARFLWAKYFDADGDCVEPAPWIHAELYNILFMVRLCTNDSLSIPLSHWPRTAIEIFLDYILSADLSSQYLKTCAQAVEEIMTRLLGSYDEIMNSPEDVLFWIRNAASTIQIYNSKALSFYNKCAEVCPTLATFVGGLDNAIFSAMTQAELIRVGYACHYSAMWLINNNLHADAEPLQEKALYLYHLAVEKARRWEIDSATEEDRYATSKYLDRLDLGTARKNQVLRHIDDGTPILDETQTRLEMQKMELEWSMKRMELADRSIDSKELHSLIDEISEPLKVKQPNKTSLKSMRRLSRHPQGTEKKNAATGSVSLPELANAYDQSDVLAAAVSHSAMAERSAIEGRIQDALRHLTRLNELVKDDNELTGKFPLLESQLEVISTANKALELMASTRNHANEGNFEAIETCWSEFHELLGSTPEDWEIGLREAYRQAREAQTSCPLATRIMRFFDEPLPEKEVKERADQASERVMRGEVSSEDVFQCETGWYQSLSDALKSIESYQYQSAIGSLEIMEQIQSTDLISIHTTSGFVRVKRWLSEEDAFQERVLAMEKAALVEPLVAKTMLDQCIELDKSLDNRHRDFLKQRGQYLRLLQCHERLKRSNQLRQDEQYVEALDLIYEIEQEEIAILQDGSKHAPFLQFLNQVRKTKFQTMAQLAVLESRYLDAAQAADQYLATMQEMPGFEPPEVRTKLIETFVAHKERSMIWHHRAELDHAFAGDAVDYESAVQHLDGLIAIGKHTEIEHSPEWIPVREGLETLIAQRNSLLGISGIAVLETTHSEIVEEVVEEQAETGKR